MISGKGRVLKKVRNFPGLFWILPLEILVGNEFIIIVLFCGKNQKYWISFITNFFPNCFLWKQTVVISIRLTKAWHSNDDNINWSAGTITGFSQLIIHGMHKVWTSVLPDLCPPTLEAESLSVVISFQYNSLKIRNSMIKMFVFMSEHEAVQSDTFSPQLLMWEWK